MPAFRFRARSGSVLHVEDEGRGQPVLAIHGLGGGAWFFAGLAKRLAGACRLVAVDLPGTGRSSCGSTFSRAGWIADLHDLATERLAAPVVLLGHSMGTILALDAWAAWPGSVRALIFAGGLPEPRHEIKERLSRRADEVARDGLAGVGPQAAAANFAAVVRERQPELVGLYERLFEAQDAAAYVAWCRMLIGASAAATVPTVRVPCLSISGREDQYAPPGLVAAFMRQLPAGSRTVVLDDCGHLPFLEAPDAFAAAVRPFLAGLC